MNVKTRTISVLFLGISVNDKIHNCKNVYTRNHVRDDSKIVNRLENSSFVSERRNKYNYCPLTRLQITTMKCNVLFWRLNLALFERATTNRFRRSARAPSCLVPSPTPDGRQKRRDMFSSQFRRFSARDNDITMT